ncbi:PspC domain-containing protein [Streptomyces sp. GSL17-111]|uniref:PspC domain-containing protein n=1 Tax=Streptomyces sp. GSL17-111 TaxID=3121596 RepID=UPI0030F3F249
MTSDEGGRTGAEDGRTGVRTAPDPAPDDERSALPERSRKSKVVAGVCGGVARHYDVDPVILRVPLAVLSVIGGLGLLLYGFAWLLLPLEGEDENEARRLLSGRVEGTGLAAVLLTLAGSGLMLASLGGDQSGVSFSLLVLLALAAGLYWSQRRRQEGAADAEAGPEPVSQVPPEAQAPPVPHAPSWWREPLTKDPQAAGTGYLWGPADAVPQKPADGAPAPPVAPGGGHGRPGQGAWPARPVPTAPERRGRRLGWAVVPAAFVAGWIGVVATWDGGSLSTTLVTGLSCALAVLALGLVVSAFAGRTGGGTVLVAVMTAGLLAGAAALPEDLSPSWSRTRWEPAAVADVRPSYDLGSGEGVLDLTGIDLAEDETVRSALTADVGEVRIVVPENARLVLDLDISLGGYRVPGTTPYGDGLEGGGVSVDETVTLLPRGDAEPRGTIRLSVELLMGETVVERAIVERAADQEAGREAGQETAGQAEEGQQ